MISRFLSVPFLNLGHEQFVGVLVLSRLCSLCMERAQMPIEGHSMILEPNVRPSDATADVSGWFFVCRRSPIPLRGCRSVPTTVALICLWDLGGRDMSIEIANYRSNPICLIPYLD
jgi:hypothetical protein